MRPSICNLLSTRRQISTLIFSLHVGSSLRSDLLSHPCKQPRVYAIVKYDIRPLYSSLISGHYIFRTRHHSHGLCANWPRNIVASAVAERFHNIKIGSCLNLQDPLLAFIMALPALVLIVLSLFIYYAGLFFSIKAPKGLRLPPGPMGLPLIGSVFHFPRVHPWRVLTEWSKIYGASLLDKLQLLVTRSQAQSLISLS